ncbi:GyrI-like domain-containing protein [Gilvimarinus sp. SDUM040013]|uniref:GyrI-like domain-containing protein n=1 Tax=Gilvimarinus gilvus TaxID=3058038 RepID=A0ABU4S5V3_9GAMM|nr:GyrI-like domain-containing protein [Gilvimarinus sp. SDUM040013]MDO3385482.1 GyrI-like domain-containing protein [Gilvimarinus sp. SDUM040013]MDX6851283.1 GyrI-like domain-containing protein [Gilvimarinus sp. SDUM040013]
MPYSQNILNAITAIESNPDVRLTLQQLSKTVGISPFHFHRLFRAQTGIAVGQFCAMSKLKRAAYQLLFRPWLSITDIALDNAYQSPEAFSRAFTRKFGCPPSVYRQQASPVMAANLPTLQDQSMSSQEIKVVQFQPLDIYELIHRGPESQLTKTIQQFIGWRKARHLSPQTSRTFNVFYSDPNSVAADEFELGLAVEKKRPVDDIAPLTAKRLPTCRCAYVRHIGPDSKIDTKLQFLYRNWLPGNQEEPGDFPLFTERIRFFPEVPEHAMITDLYLPLKD